MEKMQIIAFDMVSNTYRVLGDVVGNAFKDGLDMKQIKKEISLCKIQTDFFYYFWLVSIK